LAEKIKNKLTEEEIRVILKNILEGLNFLHELSIFHRDLKPENIMFSNKNDNESLQIIDFTLADFWN
jgi:serine/threonine protein kinase